MIEQRPDADRTPSRTLPAGELLERTLELDTLAEELATVTGTRSGRLVLLGGEAGIGKTALAQAFCSRLDSVRVLTGACEALQTARPLGPLVDVATETGGELASLVETKILPHFDFAHTTRIAMGANWRRASSEQREQLVREFRTLLVRTYSSALMNYRDQVLEFKPLRAQPGDMQVTVRSEVRQSGTQAVSIDYEMEKTASGWKVYDVKISGASLAATYRDTFAEEVRNHGIEGLIDSLSSKNRQNDARREPINT